MCGCMNDNIREIEPEKVAPASASKDAKKGKKEEGSFLWFCVKLAVIVLVFRSFAFTSFNIPSESMMPRLLVGDYLFAAKWPYGYSSRSLPFNVPLIPGRIFASTPERGDIVIFEHPISGEDYIKRVVGLPGERIQVIDSVIHINGEAVEYQQIEDFAVPTTVDKGCGSGRSHLTQQSEDGGFSCVYRQYQETLPNGVTYSVLDGGLTGGDNTREFVIPEESLFVMGDNRDFSADSRFPAEANLAVGFLPEENVIARASFMYFSNGVEGIRWSRIFSGI